MKTPYENRKFLVVEIPSWLSGGDAELYTGFAITHLCDGGEFRTASEYRRTSVRQHDGMC